MNYFILESFIQNERKSSSPIPHLKKLRCCKSTWSSFWRWRRVAHYEGKEIESSHANMHISNAEFDATLGDLKSSLDALQVPNLEQKELLAIIESTRPQIVTER